jgi:Glycosyl hydrolase catalytic core
MRRLGAGALYLLVFGLLTLFTGACATAGATARLKAVDPSAPRMLMGIGEGYRSLVESDIGAYFCGWNRDVVVRVAILAAGQAVAVRRSVASCPRIHLLLLIEEENVPLAAAIAPDLERPDLPPLWGVELGNERDLAGMSPSQFGAFTKAARDALRGGGYRGLIVTGGIYTVDRHKPQEFDRYLAPAIAACPDCAVGLHWYGDTSDRWIARVQALGKPVVITEFGMPSCTPAQDEAQRAYLQEKLAAYARVPALAAIIYTRQSAPEPCNKSDKSRLAHYGLQRPDGSWKPGEALLR